MPVIERLPDDLVTKIAAGEVVERPASVVKELVENSLDAGATQVTVEVEGGGKALVRVRDDGCGMGGEDARRALERHATSKLRTLADLQSMATHGFRGEALPSIASVSRLVLITRDDAGPAGTEVEVRYGRLVHARDAGHPRGTTVEVHDLFGAVPARRKFLRADSTEVGHAAEAVTLLALARPETGFVLKSGGRTLLQAPPVRDLSGRLYQVLGEAALEELVRVEGDEPGARITGYVSRPQRKSATRAQVRLFVNGRAVRDRAIAKAVSEAYRASGSSDPRMDAFLFLDVPLHMVDVNVHPAKTEVRFADPRGVFAAVQRAVREAISGGSRGHAPRADPGRVAETAERYLATAGVAERPRASAIGSMPAAEPRRQSPGPAESLLATGAPTVLGQHRQTYILASDGEDLLLVDQHTAHERVRFEELLDRLAKRTVESQGLLIPAVITLPPRLLPVLEANRDELSVLGFDAEPFGGNAVRLRAVPALLRGQDAAAGLEGLLADLLDRETSDWAVSGARDRLAATLACHSAFRAGEALTRESMDGVVRGLLATTHPTLCPHGRPTTMRIPRGDESRWFGRTGWKRE